PTAESDSRTLRKAGVEGAPIAGSFRNEDFSSIETGSYKPANWIEKLNERHANDIDRAYWSREKRKWPVDLMGGASDSARRPTPSIDLRQTIIETERLIRDDELTCQALASDQVQLEYYEDGYTKLPTCLDQRPLPQLARAA